MSVETEQVLNWEAFGSSPTAHLIANDAPATKRSGQRTICHRYPGKQFHAWFSIPLGQEGTSLASYGLIRCPDCVAACGSSRQGGANG